MLVCAVKMLMCGLVVMKRALASDVVMVVTGGGGGGGRGEKDGPATMRLSVSSEACVIVVTQPIEIDLGAGSRNM